MGTCSRALGAHAPSCSRQPANGRDLVFREASFVDFQTRERVPRGDRLSAARTTPSNPPVAPAVLRGTNPSMLAIGSELSHRLCAVANAVYALLTFFVLMGCIERLGYLLVVRHQRRNPSLTNAAILPEEEELPRVCTQLPMYNEHHVAVRAIDAACSLDWPRERYEVQVLDDSTDAAVGLIVDQAAEEWRRRGVDCRVLRRETRTGYKAGALEAGRRQTSARFLALFDAE